MRHIDDLKAKLATLNINSPRAGSVEATLVGRLLTSEEVDVVVGGDSGSCGPGSPTYNQSGSGSFSQTGGQYLQSGSGSYTMNCPKPETDLTL